MKRILICQILNKDDYGELRTKLDVRLVSFIADCGFLPIPIPVYNHKSRVKIKNYLYSWLNEMKPDGIVLSGGGNIYKKSLRFFIEKLLIKYSLSKSISILGICRGMQAIVVNYGGALKKIKNHVNTSHYIYSNKNKIKVNSYHKFAVPKCPRNFEILYKSKEEHIESLKHKSKNIYGWMWHPERGSFSKEFHKKNFKKIFSR
jgi:gamma-glutamyl-gamma-aminobutyrate hydrolase PuuD